MTPLFLTRNQVQKFSGMLLDVVSMMDRNENFIEESM
jgi:hypothetical protein